MINSLSNVRNYPRNTKSKDYSNLSRYFPKNVIKIKNSKFLIKSLYKSNSPCIRHFGTFKHNKRIESF